MKFDATYILTVTADQPLVVLSKQFPAAIRFKQRERGKSREVYPLVEDEIGFHAGVAKKPMLLQQRKVECPGHFGSSE